MRFNPGFDIQTTEPLGFSYGDGIFGPAPELRTLNDIRPSLRDPNCDGPANIYAIAMDTGCEKDKPDLQRRGLLFGAVTYAAGRLGEEPIRSQGHIHQLSPRCGWSTPEVYEIWQGEAVILMQETANDTPGRCFAVYAKPGDVVIVPPGWAHATVSASPFHPLTFGAWCDRNYGFVYDGVRAHGGLAFYPLLDKNNELHWVHNDAYLPCTLIEKKPNTYTQLGLLDTVPIYRQYQENPERFRFVYEPQLYQSVWQHFIP